MSIPICFAIRSCRDDLIRRISVFINTSINCVLMLLFTYSYFGIFFLHIFSHPFCCLFTTMELILQQLSTTGELCDYLTKCGTCTMGNGLLSSPRSLLKQGSLNWSSTRKLGQKSCQLWQCWHILRDQKCDNGTYPKFLLTSCFLC